MATPHAQLARRISTAFLQVVIVLMGIGVLALLLWEPHLEGRNKQATNFEVYFKDPFLAYVYVGSIPFFVALYQAFKLLGCVARDTVFSKEAVGALRIIKYCAIAIIGFVAVSVVFMRFADGDDGPPGVVIRALVIMPSMVVAVTAAIFQRLLQRAVDMQSENELTV